MAIDSDSETCAVKVGDGNHPWNELSLELGQKNFPLRSNKYHFQYKTLNYKHEIE